MQDSRKPYLPEAHLPVPTEFDCPCPLLRHYWKKLLATFSPPVCADIANELFQRNDIALAELELILHADPQAQPQELMLILARRPQATVVLFARLLHQTPVNDIRRIGHSMLSEAGEIDSKVDLAKELTSQPCTCLSEMHRQSQTLQTTQEDKHPALAELPNPLLQHYWTRLLATMSSKISMDVANKLFQSKDIAQIELEVILRPPGLQRHSQELLLILARRSYATIIRFATLLQETQVNEIQAIGCKILQDAGEID